MTEKAPLPDREGKRTQRVMVINSQLHKLLPDCSLWNVVCEGCGWTAQFRTGREAGEGGWLRHKSTHHSRKYKVSPGHECPTTHIFKTVTEKGTKAARSESLPYQITSEGEPEARDDK